MTSLTPVILVLIVLFVLFRRVRSLITRQKIRPTAMLVRMGIFLVLGGLVLVFALTQPPILEGALLGLVLGVGLAWVGLRLTRIETLPDGVYYTPNKYIGLGVFALFLLRLVYRLVIVATTAGGFSPQPGTAPLGSVLSQYSSDPLTTAIYFILIGYYAWYYGVLLLRFRTLPSTP
jgi:heme A synthase